MKKIILLSLVCFGLLAGSCKKTLDINSTRVVSEENYWNTIEDSRAALMGVYGLTRAALADQERHWLYGDMRMGNFDSPNRQDLKAIMRNDLNASHDVIRDLSDWTLFYRIINSANIFLERIGEVKAKDARYTENNMQIDIAQVRFLRAFAYFYMVRIWGDVPFIISSRDGKFENRKRSDRQAILEFVQEEMLAAAPILPYKYSANDQLQPGNYYNETEGRWAGALVRKHTVYGMLAHVAAWQGKYSDVINYASTVINDFGRGGLNFISTARLADRRGIFFDKNSEQLFGFGFVYGHQDASYRGNIESLTLAEPIVNKSVPDMYVPKDSILSIFKETNDGRFNIDTTGVTRSQLYFTNFTGRYPIFSKIKCIQDGGTDPTFRIFSSAILLTRLEDITLLRAEAYASVGENGAAASDLNRVRQRRYNVDHMGLQNQNDNDYVPYSFALHGNVIDAIFKERQKEFMGEGMHWYDQIRYHKIKQSNPAFMELINSGGIYWPIAKHLLDQNPLLTQNSYWK